MQGDLARILEAFEQAGEPMCVSQLAVELGKPPEVVGGMLDTLVELGLLRCLDGAGTCGVCPLQSSCRLLPAADRVFVRAAARLVDRAR